MKKAVEILHTHAEENKKQLMDISGNIKRNSYVKYFFS